MIAAAVVLIRYAHGAVSFTGWGVVFLLLLLFAIVSSR